MTDDLVKRGRETADDLESWVQKYTGIEREPTESSVIREMADRIEELQAERDALAAEVERLREALEPFAEIADEEDEDEFTSGLADESQAPVTLGQCRSARAALEEGKDG